MDGTGSAFGRVPDLGRPGAIRQAPGVRGLVSKVPGVMGSGPHDAQVAQVINGLLDTLTRAPMPPSHQPLSAANLVQRACAAALGVAKQRPHLLQRAAAAGQVLP